MLDCLSLYISYISYFRQILGFKLHPEVLIENHCRACNIDIICSQHQLLVRIWAAAFCIN